MNMRILLFLLLYNTACAQIWQPVTTYNYPLTDILNSDGKFVSLQTGELYHNNSLVKIFPVQYQVGWESGLLGIQEYDTGVYLHISGKDSIQRVVYFDTVTFVMDTLVSVPYTGPFSHRHRGGGMAVQEHILYIGFGYGARPEDSQDPLDLRGKIIAYDLLTDTFSVIALGLRNPFRLDVQGQDLYVGDVGSNKHEEINYFNLALDTLINYGWPCMEGTEILDSSCTGTYTNPIYSYPHNGPKSITGGVFYDNKYWFCDHYTGFGGSIDSTGLFQESLPFPQYVVGMCVDTSLWVATWNGVIYKYAEVPLSLDTLDEEEMYIRPDNNKYYIEEMIYRFGDLYYSVDWKAFIGPPTVPGMYYSLWRDKWVFID